MKYFKEIKLWKIILLNIVVVFLLSTPVLFGLIFFSGLFSPPTITDQLIGLCIFLAVLFTIVFSNFLLWKFSKKQLDKNMKNKNNKITSLKLLLLLVIIVVTIGSFFIPIISNLWLKFNGWWF